MPVKLIAIDLDGTLLTPTHQLSAATVDAIAQARAAGIEVVLASSRGPASMRHIISKLGLGSPGEFIAAQGALTGRFRPSGVLHVIHEAPIPLALAHEVVTLADRGGISTNWVSGMEWLVPRIDAMTEHQIGVLRERPTIRDLQDETRPPHKLLLIVPDDSIDEVDSLVQSLPSGLAVKLSHPTFVEITRSGIDKGIAIERLCARRGIAATEVVAIGDGQNDLGMFEFATTSIAMANADPEVLSKASMITKSNGEDGVAHAIIALLGERFGLSVAMP